MKIFEGSGNEGTVMPLLSPPRPFRTSGHYGGAGPGDYAPPRFSPAGRASGAPAAEHRRRKAEALAAAMRVEAAAAGACV